MAQSKLAQELHPYYPESWLNVASAQTRCDLAGVPFRATLTFCRQNGLEVSSTGHIRELSLSQYIERVKAQESRECLPLNGNRPFSLLKRDPEQEYREAAQDRNATVQLPDGSWW